MTNSSCVTERKMLVKSYKTYLISHKRIDHW